MTPAEQNDHAKVIHNARVNQAMTYYQVPRTFICPDCYRPPTLCEHLLAVDLQCLFHPPKK